MRHYTVNIFLQYVRGNGGTQSTITNAVVTANSMTSAATKVFSEIEDYRQQEGDAVRIEVTVGPVVAKKDTKKGD